MRSQPCPRRRRNLVPRGLPSMKVRLVWARTLCDRRHAAARTFCRRSGGASRAGRPRRARAGAGRECPDRIRQLHGPDSEWVRKGRGQGDRRSRGGWHACDAKRRSLRRHRPVPPAGRRALSYGGSAAWNDHRERTRIRGILWHRLTRPRPRNGVAGSGGGRLHCRCGVGSRRRRRRVDARSSHRAAALAAVAAKRFASETMCD